MSRFHLHVSVDDLEANIEFCSTVFEAPPTVSSRRCLIQLWRTV